MGDMISVGKEVPVGKKCGGGMDDRWVVWL